MERKWNLPAMTFRDANAQPMTDYFDFSKPAPSPSRQHCTGGRDWPEAWPNATRAELSPPLTG